MDKIIKPCPPVVGVAFGQTATLDLPIGPRYHALWLKVVVTSAAGVTLSTAQTYLDKLISLINIKVNGKVQRAHSAFELDSIQSSYGSCFAANAYSIDTAAKERAFTAPEAAKATAFYFPIFFCEPWRKSYAAQESMAWYTAWQDGSTLQSLQLEITMPVIDAATFAATAPTITAYAETDTALGPLDANKKPVAAINKWLRNTVPYAAAGDLYIPTLPKRDVYLQISAFATDDITNMKVLADSRTVRDVPKVLNDQTLIGRDMNESAIVEKRADIVFDYSDLPTDGLVMQAGSLQVNDFQVVLTMAAAVGGAVTLISQVYGGID
jgi:Viral coat protein P2 N-terminal domain